MSTTALSTRPGVLIDRLVPRDSALTDVALVAGGAAVVGAGVSSVDFSVVLSKVVLPALLAPLIAGLVGYTATRLAYTITRRRDDKSERGGFRYGQIFTSSLVALAHGTNDAQKTMGVITLTLIASGALGAGSGATFALIAQVTEPARAGGVTGLVGAAGGLGGFVPPLLMGYVYGQTDSYAIGLWLLAATAVLTLVLTLTVVRRTAAEGSAHA